MCEYCSDKVMVLRRIDCEKNCPYGIEVDNGECGNLSDCPPDGEDYYYKLVCDDENNFCPMCGRRLVEV